MCIHPCGKITFLVADRALKFDIGRPEYLMEPTTAGDLCNIGHSIGVRPLGRTVSGC